MLTYSNPRTTLVINDWPYGRNRVKATFTIEQGPKGERAVRVTENPKGGTNKPKKLTYAKKMRIVDGSDGKTYILSLTMYGHISVMQSNMQYSEESIHPGQDRFNDVLNLFEV